MKQNKNINNQKCIFFKKTVGSIVSMFLVVVSLFIFSCKKEIKAGNPITLTYDQVYMVGDATSVGWSINDAIPMKATSGNPDEFTWEGPLFAGEIKFPTALSWSSDTFMSATPGQSISDDKALLALSGNPDYHWVLTGAEAGNYKITLNTKASTVVFQKQ
jgi:SusE-like outer membrane protein